MKRFVSKSASSLLAASTLALLAAAPGCLDRPVAPQQPTTVKISTQLYRATKIDKIDLLFMIDNSASMADKQDILAQAVPDLVKRLVSPRCLDSNGNSVDFPAGGTKCPDTHPKREFDPVNDIHIGVISSSIGGHGADSCSNVATAQYNPRMEDMSHLIDRADPQDPSKKEATFQNKGFLFWDGKGAYGGDTNVDTLVQKFKNIVEGTGQDGCGFEAGLEAWYRFLVDPAPYQKMSPCPDDQGGASLRCPEGIDTTVLQQRADFLRPDSLLAVVMLMDENDCSVIDGWQNYISVQAYTGQNPWHLPRATEACKTDPGGPACMSCAQGDHSGDPECGLGGYGDVEDSLNLRCYRQKQRFGIDFLYPIRRYVNALSKKQFSAADVVFPVNHGFTPDKDFNPLFCTKYGEKEGVPNPAECATVLRDPKLVFLAAVVGVPWQDIANDPADLTKGYRPVEELGWTKNKFDTFNAAQSDPNKKRPIPPGVTDTVTVWDQILGKTITDPKNPDFLGIDWSPSAEPLDPLMIESVEPRSGTNPATGQELMPASSPSPEANKVNGHEWNISGRNDLQYACIFKLNPPKDCAGNSLSCDCHEPENYNSPLCQTDTGTYSTMQYRAKAYPGRRSLAVLHGLDPNQAIAASICPSNTSDNQAVDYGYRPAIGTIIERLRAVLAGTCWGQKLEYSGDSRVQCIVLEGSKYPEGSTTCPKCETIPGRKTPDEAAVTALSKDTNWKDNTLACACEIPQAEAGAPIKSCIESGDDPQGVDGWCYVDPEAYKGGAANANLVLTCPSDAKRMIRFVGAGNPAPGSLTFLQCKGANE